MKVLIMLTVLFIMALTMLSCKSYAETTNIISVLVGQGPTGVNTSTTSASSSSSTSSSTDIDIHRKHIDIDSTKTTTNNYYNPATNGYTQNYSGVIGLQYQHKMGSSPVWLGAIFQSNQTYSASIGIGF